MVLGGWEEVTIAEKKEGGIIGEGEGISRRMNTRNLVGRQVCLGFWASSVFFLSSGR